MNIRVCLHSRAPGKQANISKNVMNMYSIDQPSVHTGMNRIEHILLEINQTLGTVALWITGKQKRQKHKHRQNVTVKQWNTIHQGKNFSHKKL